MNTPTFLMMHISGSAPIFSQFDRLANCTDSIITQMQSSAERAFSTTGVNMQKKKKKRSVVASGTLILLDCNNRILTERDIMGQILNNSQFRSQIKLTNVF